jgi:hypothetical protein
MSNSVFPFNGAGMPGENMRLEICQMVSGFRKGRIEGVEGEPGTEVWTENRGEECKRAWNNLLMTNRLPS